MERWEAVPGYPGYEVSDAGRVRSWLNPPRSRIRYADEPHVLKAIDGQYLGVVLCGPEGRRTWAVHQLVARAFLGEPPAGQEVRHLNGQHHDCRLANLTYGTHVQNMRDAKEHGVLWMCEQGVNGWRKTGKAA